MRNARRAARDVELRQVRSDGPRRGRVARARAREPAAARRPAHAVADAERRRQADRRFHRRQRRPRPLFRLRLRHRRAISPALVRGASAAVRRRDPRAAHRAARARHRGTAIARTAVAAVPATMSRMRRCPFLSFRAMDVGDAAGARRPHLVHRRARLRDLGARRLPARALRRDRSPRAPISACGTSARARSIRCASKRASATGRANTGRSTRRRRPGSIASSMSRRRISSAATAVLRDRERRSRAPARHARRRRDRSRRDRRRAGVARRRRSSAGSRRAATAIASASRSRSATCPRRVAAASSGFEIEMLGERRPASLAPQPLHDPTGERMRHS